MPDIAEWPFGTAWGGFLLGAVPARPQEARPAVILALDHPWARSFSWSKLRAGPLVCRVRSVRTKDESPRSEKSRLGFAVTHAQDVSTAPRAGRPNGFEPTKSPRAAPDYSRAMEDQDQALLPGPRCAHRLLAVLLRQGRPRAL